MDVKDMPTGAILWFESVVIGVKDITNYLKWMVVIPNIKY